MHGCILVLLAITLVIRQAHILQVCLRTFLSIESPGATTVLDQARHHVERAFNCKVLMRHASYVVLEPSFERSASYGSDRARTWAKCLQGLI